MSHVSKRAGAAHSCICKVCGHSFTRQKLTATCSSACKAIYKATSPVTTPTQNTKSQAIHQGAIQHDTPNQNRC